MNAVVALDTVSKNYGPVAALDSVSLDLVAGETVALAGHNGAGKTTLMKLALGLARPSSGTIRVFGQDPAGRHGARARRRVGFLPESAAFHGAMTGLELLAFYARLKRARVEPLEELLERVGLDHAANRRVGTYSKGMRQRLALAQALIGEPGLLLLDEPTSGLDPDSRMQVYETIDRLRAEGSTILISTHALAEIESHADRVALLHRGKLLAAGELQALRRKAALPSRITLVVRPCHTERVLSALTVRAEVRARSEERLVLAVPHADKIAALRDIAGLGETVTDIEITEPGLEALYHSLTREDGR
ncbi:MAG: hypothetical protein TEF_12120 [Rhizobiales bacterium NRL2]|jgi:Cu-processing system ATP-binding protein|nr:MAG: hypothetical protein TEF_12120 [Rhizobiales bacterium NRL2]